MSVRRQLLPALVMLGVFTVICGLVYPLAVTGVAQAAMGDRADGFLSDYHARDNVYTASLALDAEYRFLALRVESTAAIGALKVGRPVSTVSTRSRLYRPEERVASARAARSSLAALTGLLANPGVAALRPHV